MNARTTPTGGFRRRRTGGGTAAALVAGALALAGCGAAAPSTSGQASSTVAASSSPSASVTMPPQVTAAPSPAPSGPAPSGPALSGPAGSAKEAIPVRPATLAANPASPAPTSITVAGTAINMPVVPGGVSAGGAMEIPDVFDRAAWYRFGPAPGAAEGAAVIAGHIDTTSDRAPFSALKSLQAGTIIRVGRGDAPAVTYRVVRVELMAKDRFDGASLFRRSGPHELKLVTCGGTWLDERMDYSDNVIVTAVPA
ncbi:class F sortase [Pseudarthrobacter sp. C4D7]|uniref:class F sortase n=1 Tax=Pseudarthrobacter sp. C4D7 TaxID=2735268 RepID=UPI0015852C75|nr:class F sortase [Pseudarthrobacter sp. C4D7]NUT71416.1 class F sortase [Pseudarthrobacter sp. C4D7]